MIWIMCSIHDSAVGAYGRPFAAPSRAAASRSFADEVNRAGSEFNAHPEDYVLNQVGEFDDDKGMFLPFEVVDRITRGKDVKHVS